MPEVETARTRRKFWTILTLIPLTTLPATRATAADADALRPGLVATYHDGDKPAPHSVNRREPTVALALHENEAAHPLLGPGGGAVWQGQLKILRPGPYRFSAVLRGSVRVTVAGKDALTAEVADGPAVLKEGKELELQPGILPFRVEFTRPKGDARLELLWQSDHFLREPLAYEQLGHLPSEETAQLTRDEQAEHGRFVVEEHNCVACHKPDGADRLAQGLLGRVGPDLRKAGTRLRPEWVYTWLDDPAAVRHGAVMPSLFGKDAKGREELFAVTQYLASLGGALAPGRVVNQRDYAASVGRGRRLFNSVGCTACHTDKTLPIGDIAAKTTPDRLSEYLRDPLAIDPSGRMPHMQLDPKEAEDVARFLFDGRNVVPAPLPIPAGQQRNSRQWQELGKQVVTAKGCVNCHTLPNDVKATTAGAFATLRDPARNESGCLAKDAAKRKAAPRFTLSDDDAAAVRGFLTHASTGAGSPAPAHAAAVAIQRFGCLSCHTRDGVGGLSPDLVEQLRRFENAEHAEAVSPPPLTGIAHKLRPDALQAVLVHGARVRPWMAMRMPQFGPKNVGTLAAGLTALEGLTEQVDGPTVKLTPQLIETGRHLNGKTAFGCISCHDLAGVPNFGTRGPDLALTPQRVRYEWYRRWLEQAQRMQPGTRMPTAFNDGQSPLQTVFSGSADKQAEAMWAYLSLGKNLPLPDGMEPPKGLALTVEKKPRVLRTFMPEAGSRAIAVGYPDGISYAFDAAQCRLAFAWAGNFLDASPVWNNRGGNPAKVLGNILWTAPEGCPLAVTHGDTPPDFAALAREPARGAPLKGDQVYSGPMQVQFRGHGADASGRIAFRYHLAAEGTDGVNVVESPTPLRSGAGAGVARNLTLETPAGQTVWLLADRAPAVPRVLEADGRTAEVAATEGKADLPAAGRVLVLPKSGDRVVLLSLTDAPEGAQWSLRKVGNDWTVMLRLPATGANGTRKFALNVWSPYRAEPSLLKEFLTAR